MKLGFMVSVLVRMGFEVVDTYIIYYYLQNVRFRKRMIAAVMIPILIGMVMVYVVLMGRMGSYMEARIALRISMVIWLFDGNLRTKLLWFIPYSVAADFSHIILAEFMTKGFGLTVQDTFESMTAQVWQMTLGSVLVYIVVYVLYREKNRREQPGEEGLIPIYSIILCIFSIAVSAMTFACIHKWHMIYGKGIIPHIGNVVVWCICMTIVGTSLYVMVKMDTKKCLVNQTIVKQDHYEDQKVYYTNLYYRNNEFVKFRLAWNCIIFDLQQSDSNRIHHIISDKKMQNRLERLISQIPKFKEYYGWRVYTDNDIVDAVINSFRDELDANRIGILYKGVMSDKAKASEVELGMMFANSIRNGIDRCKMNGTKRQQVIEISLEETPEMIVLRIENADQPIIMNMKYKA